VALPPVTDCGQDHLSTDAAGEHVGLSRGFLEELGRHERVEQGIAYMWVECPEALDLRLRELETGHFEVLGLNETKPILDHTLLGSHCRFLFRGQTSLAKKKAIVVPHQIDGNSPG
jgi:hypothetical protein